MRNFWNVWRGDIRLTLILRNHSVFFEEIERKKLIQKASQREPNHNL